MHMFLPVHVGMHNMHYGHETCLHLSQGDHDKITASLSTFVKILDDIWDNVDASFSHIHLLIFRILNEH